MDNALFLLASDLRAVAHVMHYMSYIEDITKDTDFSHAIVDVFSDYLYFKSDEIFSKLSNFTDTGFDRCAVFGGAFPTDEPED